MLCPLLFTLEVECSYINTATKRLSLKGFIPLSFSKKVDSTVDAD